ncbi:MAG: dihydrofolate reductase family protein, partial [Candidatus Dormibacteraeota bacterium]|nr:dihydrofolate reductase family protein [Candidatus Dormibacteraeota bacterium]
GPSLLGSAFDLGVVQRVVAMLSPRVLGGTQAPSAVAGQGAARLDAVPLLSDVQVERCGPDIVVSGYCVTRDV